jgi:hypothetical protein
MEIIPAIVCIAKLEQTYIEEFVKYHIQLNSYSQNVKVIHLPGRIMQYVALRHFTKTFMMTNGITHATHIDVDEFIVLKKHKNIVDFINEYIKCPNNNLPCGGIAMNWRFFGSSGHQTEEDEPVTQRFVKCSLFGDQHVKTLFNVRLFKNYNTCHNVSTKNSFYSIKTTDNRVVSGPFNPNPDMSVIQLNHYKCKTLPEFLKIRGRGRADILVIEPENVKESFKIYDINETCDLVARDFYLK